MTTEEQAHAMNQSDIQNLATAAAIVVGLILAAACFAAGYITAQPEFDPTETTEHVAYTIGVAEGARREALKHCPCDARRFLGATCNQSK